MNNKNLEVLLVSDHFEGKCSESVFNYFCFF